VPITGYQLSGLITSVSFARFSVFRVYMSISNLNLAKPVSFINFTSTVIKSRTDCVGLFVFFDIFCQISHKSDLLRVLGCCTHFYRTLETVTICEPSSSLATAQGASQIGLFPTSAHRRHLTIFMHTLLDNPFASWRTFRVCRPVKVGIIDANWILANRWRINL